MTPVKIPLATIHTQSRLFCGENPLGRINRKIKDCLLVDRWTLLRFCETRYAPAPSAPPKSRPIAKDGTLPGISNQNELRRKFTQKGSRKIRGILTGLRVARDTSSCHDGCVDVAQIVRLADLQEISQTHDGINGRFFGNEKRKKRCDANEFVVQWKSKRQQGKSDETDRLGNTNVQCKASTGSLLHNKRFKSHCEEDQLINQSIDWLPCLLWLTE